MTVRVGLLGPGRTVARNAAAMAQVVAEMEAVAAKLQTEGRKVDLIPGRASDATGGLGHLSCALDLVGQANHPGLVIEHLVTATGSAGTQAGLIAGPRAIHAGVPVVGMGVRAPKEKQEANVFALAQKAAEKLGCPGVVQRGDVVADCNYVAAGYGIPREDTLEAIGMFAEPEVILLDPAHSGRAVAGLIDYCRKGRAKKDERVVVRSTGGSAALFGYDAVLAEGNKAMVPC